MTAQPIIDLHSHFFPPAVVAALSRRAGSPRIDGAGPDRRILSAAGALQLGPHWHDVEHRLADLDGAGVVHQLLSWPTTLGLEPAMRLAEARPFWRAVNDGFADLVRAYPDRFSALAVVSTADIDWSVGELRRAHDELGLIGLVLPINAFGSRAGIRHLAPLLAEAQRLGSHLYLHTGYAADAVPGQPPAITRDDAPALAWTLAAMHHFANSFATIALTDALDDYPDLTVQVAMLGGAGAAALLIEQATIAPARVGSPPRRDRLDRLWLDTGAIGQGPEAIGLAARVLGPDRILFGSDYAPADDLGTVIAHVCRAPLSAAQLAAIFHANARALLARHGVTVPVPAKAPGDPHVRT